MQDSSLDEAIFCPLQETTFPSSCGTLSETVRAERSINPNSTEVYWRFQNYTYEFGRQAGEAHWWLLECWWVKRLVWSLDRIHSIYSIGRETYRRKKVVWGEINEKTKEMWSTKQGKKERPHSPSLMDLCHLKNADLEPKFQKHDGRVVLRGDTVEDDSGSYAVFTEQGSSAPQMTAAKVMDVIARLPGCAGQAAHAVSAETQVKMEDAPSLKKIYNRNVQIFGFVYHDTNGQNHGTASQTQSFLLSEICMVILWQDCYGKGNLRTSYCSTVGRRFPIGNACSFTVKKCYSYLCMWMTSNWLERDKTLIRCGKYSTKKSIWEHQHLSLIMYTWDALNVNVK